MLAMSAQRPFWHLAPVRTPLPARAEPASDRGPSPGSAEPGQSGRQMDRAVVCDVLARRPGAVASAWRHFVPFVRRVLGKLVHGGRDVEDLTQEVFERFFRKIDELRNPDAVRAFLYGVALRVAKKEHRYRWLRRDLQVGWDSMDVPAEGAGDGGLDSDDREAARRLLQHLGTLSSEHRSLIVARYVEGMELEEVALAHGMAFNTMRRRLERAWNALDRRLQHDELFASYRRNKRGGRP
jgi:RNA polymerase sigma-70 factor (ECF subfamily)